jgi:hypothetical protein
MAEIEYGTLLRKDLLRASSFKGLSKGTGQAQRRFAKIVELRVGTMGRIKKRHWTEEDERGLVELRAAGNPRYRSLWL